MKGIWAAMVGVLNRPTGKIGRLVLLGMILTAPAWLFFAPTDLITREPLRTYRLHRDDFEYLARSRTLPTAIANLFVPHNTHVVPAWRLVTWVMVVIAGTIKHFPDVLGIAAYGTIRRFPDVLGVAAYGILAATMLLVGRLVGRETRRPALGLAATILAGTTSVMLSAGSWYSAGQTLWAGFGILAMLSWLQRWRRWGGTTPLILAGIAAMISGWLWTVGHIAGLVGAAYLVADRRPASRKAALVPGMASAAAVVITIALARGAVRIETGDGGTGPGGNEGQAISVVSGITHTLQAIPETLILGNLGLIVETVPIQGAILTIGLFVLWAWSRRATIPRSSRVTGVIPWPNPLEAAGMTMIISAYLLEWTFRGYLPFSSLRWQVPWYDTIPQIGAVLFGSGWCSALLDASPPGTSLDQGRQISRVQAMGLASLAVAMVIVNRPRVDEKWHYLAPAMLPSERAKYPVHELRMQRDHYLFQDQAEWQRRHLFKLEQAEKIAQRQGIGRDTIRSTFGRLGAPLIPEVYDAAGLLDIPEHGTPRDAAALRALVPLLSVDPEERPGWLEPNDPWPPPVAEE